MGMFHTLLHYYCVALSRAAAPCSLATRLLHNSLAVFSLRTALTVNSLLALALTNSLCAVRCVPLLQRKQCEGLRDVRNGGAQGFRSSGGICGSRRQEMEVRQM